MRMSLFLSLILLVVAFSTTAFVVYEIAPRQPQGFMDIETNTALVNEAVFDDFPDGILFYNNIRFPANEISYSIDQNCEGFQANEARKAFGILENQTVLDFEEEAFGQIKVSCSEEENVPREGFFIAGEGGPTSIVNATNFYVIGNGTILLYRENKCDTPIVAIHEILHVLGFKHSSNKKSIMYDVSNCNQRLTPEIVQVISDTYSYSTLPDLTIREASAMKSGGRLSFEVEVFNSGLDYSSDSKIGIYADGELIREYDTGELEIGSGKVISVSNMRVPRNLQEVIFKIDSQEIIFEINEENNDKKLVVV